MNINLLEQEYKHLNQLSIKKLSKIELEIFYNIANFFKNNRVKEHTFEFNSILNNEFNINIENMTLYLFNISSLSFLFSSDDVNFIFPIFSSFIVDKSNNNFKISLNEKVGFAVMKLIREFEFNDLYIYNQMNSIYAKNLFLYLLKNEFPSEVNFSLSDLRTELNIAESYAPGKINERVLLPIKKEFNKINFDILIEKTKEGVGNKISNYKFTINKIKVD